VGVGGNDFVNLLFLTPDFGDFALYLMLKDSNEFLTFLLTVGQVLYKYMRIHLWTVVWQRFCVV